MRIPEEYVACAQALTGDNGLSNARSVLSLLAKARKNLERSLADNNQENINAYCAA